MSSGLPLKADIAQCSRHFAFVPQTDLCNAANGQPDSITSSALGSSDVGMLTPIAFAVLRLTTISNFTGSGVRYRRPKCPPIIWKPREGGAR